MELRYDRLQLIGAALAAVALLIATAAPGAAQGEDTELALSAFGGFTTDPGGFDVFREAQFDAGAHLGGAVAFRLGENLAVRGDMTRAWSSGEETGVLNESVDFDRTYYGVALEARFPLASVTPYLLGGGGLVTVDRTAPSRNYNFDSFGGQLGAGIALPLSNSPIELFVEGTSWFYGRESTGEGTQTDLRLSGGITFIPDL